MVRLPRFRWQLSRRGYSIVVGVFAGAVVLNAVGTVLLYLHAHHQDVRIQRVTERQIRDERPTQQQLLKAVLHSLAVCHADPVCARALAQARSGRAPSGLAPTRSPGAPAFPLRPSNPSSPGGPSVPNGHSSRGGGSQPTGGQPQQPAQPSPPSSPQPRPPPPPRQPQPPVPLPMPLQPIGPVLCRLAPVACR